MRAKRAVGIRHEVLGQRSGLIEDGELISTAVQPSLVAECDGMLNGGQKLGVGQREQHGPCGLGGEREALERDTSGCDQTWGLRRHEAVEDLTLKRARRQLVAIFDVAAAFDTIGQPQRAAQIRALAAGIRRT